MKPKMLYLRYEGQGAFSVHESGEEALTATAVKILRCIRTADGGFIVVNPGRVQLASDQRDVRDVSFVGTNEDTVYSATLLDEKGFAVFLFNEEEKAKEAVDRLGEDSYMEKIKAC